MKKYNKFSLLIIVTVTVLFFTGCVKDLTGTVYNGADLVEFANPVSKTITTTAAPKPDSILVQLVGKQRTTATSVTYTTNASSTAIAGTDYTIVTPSPVVIAANTSSTWIKFTLNKVSTVKTIMIDLTGGDAVQPSVNYKTFTFTLK